jgi:hypothetical protein
VVTVCAWALELAGESYVSMYVCSALLYVRVCVWRHLTTPCSPRHLKGGGSARLAIPH